ncbi:transposase family protein [Rhodopirellula sp. SWK7]|uniref:transposase family protein n=1 Tax=Rhodopirellula sp. SWK7 TaxID=595460 RepID=UPI00191BD9AD
MSTTLLHQSFGIRDYRQTRIEFTGGVTRFHVEPSEKKVCCPMCGSRNVIRRGFKRREFQASPIGLRQTVVAAALPRVQCHDCGTTR